MSSASNTNSYQFSAVLQNAASLAIAEDRDCKELQYYVVPAARPKAPTKQLRHQGLAIAMPLLNLHSVTKQDRLAQLLPTKMSLLRHERPVEISERFSHHGTHQSALMR